MGRAIRSRDVAPRSAARSVPAGLRSVVLAAQCRRVPVAVATWKKAARSEGGTPRTAWARSAVSPPPSERCSGRDLDALQPPLKDGCQRNPAGLLTFSSPEWVYVYGGDPEVRTLEGTVHVPSPAGEDLPENHLSYDMDANVAPDAPYQYLLGGDPNAK